MEVPFDKGLAGHSDGDALSHAICDALLGAAGLGDIGQHFPDDDPHWRDASSLRFLEHTRDLVDKLGFEIGHIDSVVMAEQPRLGRYFGAMRQTLARALAIPAERINLKAKTGEGMGEIGRGEAMAAQAVALLEARKQRSKEAKKPGPTRKIRSARRKE
jgi:2-C-methyl-D-erythritol 2,4-cyclodiphosphate synthase